MVGMLSDIGKLRSTNQDYSAYDENLERKIYIIADGMGGHNAGEVASKIAVDTTMEYINSICCLENLEKVLKEAIEFSNKKVYEMSKTDVLYNGMGTTMIACLVKESNMIVANVGDSRCYIINKEGIHQLTKDHSLVQELVDSGTITQEEAAVHPNKNIITRAVGTTSKVDIDTYKVNMKDIYKVILCTDGLTDYLTDKEIYSIAMENDSISACRKLVELSNERGGKDNITVIIFEGECRDGWNSTR